MGVDGLHLRVYAAYILRRPAMSKRKATANRIELLQGTLDLLILQTLQRGPLHGYAISQHLRVRSRDAFQVDTGALYPALHRLEREGSVAATWTIAGDTGQRVRVYRLTPRGRRRLADERSRWQRMSAAMYGVLSEEGEP
jgi:PadR family transcriptional regulator, regulatory protein PadR